MIAGRHLARGVAALAEAAFGGWTRRRPLRLPTLAPPQPAGARLIIVDKPGAPQTEVRVGAIGISRKSPDYTPEVVMNAVLGGMFSSRINLNLREDKGYTYGAFSSFRFNRTEGPFIVTSAVRTDVTAPALTEVLKEVRAIAQQPIPDGELSQAKELIVRSLPTRFETSASAAASYAIPYIYDLGLDYWSGYPKGSPRSTPPRRRPRRRNTCSRSG